MVKGQWSKVDFPSLCLIASGGHTELLLMKNHGQYRWLGGTRDDAAGECFDKCSRLLQLGYPGGPAIAAAAAQIQNAKIKMQNDKVKFKINLPKPMLNQDNFDFSFSGIKTAVLNILKNYHLSAINNQQFNNYLAFEIQEAITDVLVQKTLRAAQKFRVKSILVGGGVASNDRLREKFQSVVKGQRLKVKLFIPDKKFCTDNAAVIASAAYFNYQPVPWQKIKADPGLEIITPIPSPKSTKLVERIFKSIGVRTD
jgi:N6-L-threonylcarbamoyladenine synthase